MARRLPPYSLVVIAILAGACGGSVCADGDACGTGGTGATGGGGATGGTGATGGGGATGGTGGSHGYEQTCHDACAKIGCPGYDSAACFSECAQTPDSVPPECKTSYQTVIACAAYKGTFTCDSSEPQLQGCDAEMNVFMDCMTNSGF